MKQFILTIFLFSYSLIYSQIDTNKIIKEIKSLTNDSLINVYWQKLDSIDQNINTFSNPILQTENLVKCLYFFKYFGFSELNRFERKSMSYSDAEMRAKIIWMHSSFTDLNIYTFPLIIECYKVDKNFDYPDYFIQNVQIVRTIENLELDKKVISNLENETFEKVDLKKVVELSNEFIQLQLKIDKTKIIDTWKSKNDNSSKTTIEYKHKIIKLGKTYYFESMGNFFKLLRSKKNKNIFFFVNEIDKSYLEIYKNGELNYKDNSGKIIESFIKI